ncbi:MAG: DUF6054 family protein [Oscillospiraceae bacterium]|jgi:hypothetical protein|nr:DUF6054 family protein [Oscillospiraceae bacterium]
MAKAEYRFAGDFNEALHLIESSVNSLSSSLEEQSDFRSGYARCAVRVFERYSMMGNNRVSLSVTLFTAGDGAVYISAAATGGSQAVFFKINTFGEESFLGVLNDALADRAERLC